MASQGVVMLWSPFVQKAKVRDFIHFLQLLTFGSIVTRKDEYEAEQSR
jgi:hypothetical protein